MVPCLHSVYKAVDSVVSTASAAERYSPGNHSLCWLTERLVHTGAHPVGDWDLGFESQYSNFYSLIEAF